MGYEKLGWPHNIIAEIHNRPTSDVFFNEFRFEQTLNNLDKRQSDVIIQHFKNGETYKDIAEDMKLSSSRVSALASAAIRGLKSHRKEFEGVSYDETDAANRMCKKLSEENDALKKEIYVSGASEEILKNVDTQMILKTELVELGLETRTATMLKRKGITTLGDLSRLGRTEAMMRANLWNIRNFGKKCEADLIAKLEAHGYSLEQLAAIEYKRWYAEMTRANMIKEEGGDIVRRKKR